MGARSSSFDQLLEQLAPRLLRYCRGRLVDAQLAEEVAQDAMLALVSRWRRLGPPESPEAFVFSIARRRAFRAAVRSRILLPLERLRSEPSPTPTPEESFEDRERRRQLIERLNRLPSRDREALLLIGAAELDQKTAAGLLGISVAALKMRLYRARQRLQRAEQGPAITSLGAQRS